MYLRLTNDNTASFYNNESTDRESMKVFRFNVCHYPDTSIPFCFEAVITDDLRSFFKRLGIEMDEDQAKLQFYLHKNGDIGPCSQK